MENKKGANSFIAIVIIVILIIIAITYFKNGNSINEETAKCIASKSILYTSKTCSHCAEQKEILGDYLALFKIIECIEQAQECEKNGILGIPAWTINNQKYYGVKTLKELKKISEC